MNSATRTSFYDVERYSLMNFILESKGEYFPSLDQMKEVVAMQETSDTIRERLAEINKEHSEVLNKFFEWEASHHYSETMDHYLSYDDGIPFLRKELDKLPQKIALDSYGLIRTSHCETVVPLRAKLAPVKASEMAEQRRIDSQFPLTITDYRNMRDKQARMRVTRFLMLDDRTPGNAAIVRVNRDRVMSQFGWAWIQVTPLCNEYLNNGEFRNEVKESVKEIEIVSDPRRKRP